jgi:hypothetical protein
MLRKAIVSFLALTSLVLVDDLPTAAAKPRVDMEVIFEPGLAGNTAAQKWTKALADLGLSGVRFRALENGDQMGVATQGTGDSAVYQVTAQLNSRGTLITPGGQFMLSDSTKLKSWLDQVAAGGGKAGAPATPFGLTAKQFDEVKTSLSPAVGFSTKGLRPEKVIEQLQGTCILPLTIAQPIQKALTADDAVRDELQGVSLGTALAAVLRPVGGALIPHNGHSGLELALTTPTAGSDVWPIGWPPDERDESKVVPKLFEFTPVETDGALPANQAIDAIQAKLGLSLLYDYNNLVKKRIDLKKQVKVTAGKTYFRRILDRVLFQTGLKAEVRLDDSGKPLLWVTTL